MVSGKDVGDQTDQGSSPASRTDKPIHVTSGKLLDSPSLLPELSDGNSRTCYSAVDRNENKDNDDNYSS